MFKNRNLNVVAVAAFALLFALAAVACGSSDPEIIEVEKPVIQEVIKEVAVPGETIVVEKEVIRTVEVEKPVIQEVIKEVAVPGETIVVETEVVETVEVPVVQTEIVEVTKEVMVQAEPMAPLIIGQLNAFSGSLSYFGTSHRNSATLGADHVNRAGGVGGGSVVIVSRDTAVNPVQGVDAARALVNVENAAAIVGALASGVTIPVSTSVTTPNQVVQISGSSTAPGITVLEDDDFLFRTAPSDAAQGVVLANLALEQGYQNVGILYINNAYGEGLAHQFTNTFTELGGTVSASVPHEDSQPTFVSELEKATEGGAEVLIAMSYPGQAEIYLREALEGGYAHHFLFVDGTKSVEMFETLGWDAFEGSMGTAPGSPGNPNKDAFNEAYLNAFAMSAPEEPFNAETYDAVVLIALAAAKAGTTTDSVAIRDALRDVANPPGQVVGPGVNDIALALKLISEGTDVNYEGAAGPVDFDENGDVFGPIEIWQIQGGEFVSVRFETP